LREFPPHIHIGQRGIESRIELGDDSWWRGRGRQRAGPLIGNRVGKALFDEGRHLRKNVGVRL